MKAFALIALLALAGCASTAAAGQRDTQPTAPPIPVLKVGEPAAIDLFGDGQVTVTVASAEAIEDEDTGRVRLVAAITITLDKAGDAVSGGPENFGFLDANQEMHPARTSRDAFPPELTTASFTTDGQQEQGKVFFEVPAEAVAGGHIQLMTGALVHAVWRV